MGSHRPRSTTRPFGGSRRTTRPSASRRADGVGRSARRSPRDPPWSTGVGDAARPGLNGLETILAACDQAQTAMPLRPVARWKRPCQPLTAIERPDPERFRNRAELRTIAQQIPRPGRDWGDARRAGPRRTRRACSRDASSIEFTRRGSARGAPIRSVRSWRERRARVRGLRLRLLRDQRGFAECHHRQPLSHRARAIYLRDLAVVCANCQRMLHRGDFVSVEELRDSRGQRSCSLSRGSLRDTEMPIVPGPLGQEMGQEAPRIPADPSRSRSRKTA